MMLNEFAAARRAVLPMGRVSTVLTTMLVLLATLATFLPFGFPEFVAYPLGIVLIWFLPGYFVEGILFPAQRAFSLTRLPIWFVFGLFVWALPATALQFLNGTWLQFHFVYCIALWGLGLASVWRRARVAAQMQERAPQAKWSDAILLALCAGLALYMTQGPRDADDWLYLQIAQQILGSNPFQLQQASEARYTLRYAFHVWLFTQAFFAEWFQVDLVMLAREILPPLVGAMGLLSFFALARELFGGAKTALVAVAIQLVIAFTHITGSGWGSGLVERAAQDKFLVWLVVVPLALLWAWQFLNSGARAALVAYAVALVAGLWIHPVALFLILLSLGGLMLFNLISRVPFSRARWAMLWLATAPVLGAPLVIRLTTLPEVFNVASPFASAYVRLSEDRLWIFGDWYIINLELVSHPLIVLSLFALVLSARQLRTDARVQFLWGSALVPLALLSNPFTARVLGEMLTPWQLWRLTWNVPSALVLAYAAQQFFRARAARPPRLAAAPLALLALAFVFAFGVYPLNPARWYNNLTKGHALDANTQDMLFALRAHLQKPSNVLLPRALTRYASAYTYRAVVLSNEAQKPEDARGREIDRFYDPNADPQFLAGFLRAWESAYVVAPNDSHADRFLQTYARAKFLYRNAVLTLYEIAP